jgi:hypothetical protein
MQIQSDDEARFRDSAIVQNDMDDVKDEHITPVGLVANGHNVADYERAHVGHMKGEHVNIMEKLDAKRTLFCCMTPMTWTM